MKLIRCHIEGFGAFCKQDFVFDEAITEFCHHNGWGKTTLVDFITAMLYGLPNANARGGFSKRQRYLPFDGGRFGGNLHLGEDGKEWRIERFFDPKSGTKDTLTVYCNNREVPMERGEVGLRLLGVDEDTFRRLSLIGDEQLDVGDNEKLGGKLQSTLDDTPDTNQYEDVLKVLDDLIKLLKPARKTPTNKGKIPAMKEKIQELGKRIENLQAISATLPGHYQAHREIQERLAGVNAHLATIRAYDLQKQKWDTYQGYLADVEKARGEISFLLTKYPAGFPTQEELNRLKTLDIERIGLDAQQHTADLGEDAARLALIKEKYPTGLPDQEELAKGEGALLTYEEQKSQLTAIQNEGEEPLDAKVAELFVFGVPNQESLQQMRSLTDEIDAIETKLQVQSAAQSAVAPKKKPIGLMSVLFGGGGVLAVVGGVLLSTQFGIGITLLVLGLLSLVGGVVVSLGGKTSVDNTAILSLQTEKGVKEATLRNLLIPYRLGGSPRADFERLRSALETYRTHQERRERRDARLMSCQEKMREAKARLDALLHRYLTPTDNPRRDFETLKTDKGDWERLTESERRRTLAKNELREALARNAREIATILARYQLGVPDSLGKLVEELQRDHTNYEDLLKTCEDNRRRAQKFYVDEKLTQEPMPVEGDTAALEEERDRLQNDLATKWREIEEYEQEIVPLVELEETLAALKEELKTLEEQYEMLSLTRDFIEQAEKNIVDRYVGPVRETLNDYLSKVELVLGEGLRLDEHFSLQYEASGALRPEGHLSAGQRAICGLCFRLAMLPHLYQDATPFVLLDDPFGTVDGIYLEKLKELLKELSKEIQIVYFCCHESRSVL